MQEGPALDVFYDRNSGTLEAVVQFLPSGDRLAVFLEVEEREDYLAWKRYAFEFMDRGGRTIFRYDNVPHQHGLPLFPEHKHVGPAEAPQAAPAPSVHDLIREISQHERRRAAPQ